MAQLTEGCREAIMIAIPELAESEDERIRKKLIGIFTNQSLCDVYNLKSEDVLAYLERQKEQKHYCPSNDDLEDAAREFRGKCLPPIEPISDELIDIIKDEFEGFRRLLKKKGIDYEPQRSYWEGFARLFDSSAREYVKEQKEQKPVENNVIIPQFHIGDYIKPKAYNEEHLIKDINKNGYVLDIDMIIPFKDEDVWQLAEQKPAEWSEDVSEDVEEEILNSYDESLHERWTKCPYTIFQDIARHFYELGRKSKGAEWTEKDIENGSYISAFLQANCGNNVILKEATMWFMSRLRQLPIQQSKVQPVCEDLKKRVSEIYPNKEGDLYSLHSTLQRGGYIRGYQDCKDEMMKKAVEGEIINAGYPTKIELNTFYSKFEHGQKVKLIIIKEA